MVSLFSTRKTQGSIRVPELVARIACRLNGRLDYWAHDHGSGCDGPGNCTCGRVQ